MENEARADRFQRLYSAHSEEILRFAVRRGMSRQDAEEVVVETFIVCWRRLEEVPEFALPWLLTVARYVLLNQRRTTNRFNALRHKLALTPTLPSATSADTPDKSERVLAALALLAESDRRVLELVAWQHKSHEEAAEILGCSRNAFTKRYKRARDRLEALLTTSRT